MNNKDKLKFLYMGYNTLSFEITEYETYLEEFCSVLMLDTIWLRKVIEAKKDLKKQLGEEINKLEGGNQ